MPSPVRRAYRSRESAVLGGVCAGLADHVGWPVKVIRVSFVVLSLVQFFGVMLYAMLWIVLPRRPEQPVAPGLISAERRGMRPVSRAKAQRDLGSVTALALLGIGAVWLMQSGGIGVSASFFWPMAFAMLGVALIWRQVDETGSDAEVIGIKPAWLRPLLHRGGWPAILRAVVGMGLVGASVSMVAASQIGITQLPTMLAMTALALVGVGMVAAPWLYQMQRRLQQAQEARILADARADMAAHLHDSVLQTLALIQRQADDPKAVATLARRQERELRNWLYGEVEDATTLKAALTKAAAEIELERGVPVELICVGDIELTSDLAAMVRAAREAIMNAAKHSGADSIDVYAEVDEPVAEIFVRDRGRGFTLDGIADDRMGVRRSIIERMERHGGTASIRSAPGEGTEIRLEMST